MVAKIIIISEKDEVLMIPYYDFRHILHFANINSNAQNTREYDEFRKTITKIYRLLNWTDD